LRGNKFAENLGERKVKLKAIGLTQQKIRKLLEKVLFPFIGMVVLLSAVSFFTQSFNPTLKKKDAASIKFINSGRC
jgi:hypothetical protein